MSSLHRALYSTAWTSIIGTLALLLLLVFWNIYPYKVAEVTNAPLPVINKDAQVEAGGLLLLRLKAVKHSPVRWEICRQLVNALLDPQHFHSTNIVVHHGFSALPAGTYDTLIHVPIPGWVPPGTYRLLSVYIAKVNPVREIVIEVYSQPFEVVEPDEK